MKIALVHDYLIQDGGAEKVFQVFMDMWPEAPCFTLFFDQERFPHLREKSIQTSFLERMPFASRKYQWYLPLMPTATERYDLTEFDVVLSSTSAFAKGIITRPDALHLCYCHTPTRYLWSDTHSYIEELRMPRPVKALLPPLLSALRVWDHQAANRVDIFLANSATVQERIQKYYQRESLVLHPPVETERFRISEDQKDYFLAGGRLVAYKRFDLVVEAANRTGLPVVIFGSGPEEARLRAQAKPNVRFVGRVPDHILPNLYAHAKAFIHPHVEDFGITPVESMSAGRPVIALRQGGATETVVQDKTGVFFDEQSWEELADTMIRFDECAFDPETIRAHAAQFSRSTFEKALRSIVADAWKRHQETHRPV